MELAYFLEGGCSYVYYHVYYGKGSWLSHLVACHLAPLLVLEIESLMTIGVLRNRPLFRYYCVHLGGYMVFKMRKISSMMRSFGLSFNLVFG
jgi:hypothetical protein